MATVEPISYSVEVPDNARVVVYPPESTTTTTVPSPAPTIPATFQEDRTVGLAVPSGGGNLLLGSSTRAGWPIAADSKEVVDDVGKDTVILARSSSGTVVVEVLVIP